MTPEEKNLIRDLPKLIANENDFDKMKVLALELARLLARESSWKEKYIEAALETDFAKVPALIQAAESAIQQRQRVLSESRSRVPEESNEMAAALIALKALRGDILHWRDQQK